jgi:hypothetical protein
MSGSGGSGILIARKADGTWSEPSGILLHTTAVGFVLGVDIYDCVLVINSVPILEMFASPRVTLGADVSLTVGPLVSSDAPDGSIVHRSLDHSVLTYLKARGTFQAVRLDGSLVTERTNENERFYHCQPKVLDILASNVPKDIPEIRPLFEVIKAAEGRKDFDAPLLELLSKLPAPGDAVIDHTMITPQSPQSSSFGVPDVDDPDPFGVIALEMAGLEIREAGTKLRPNSDQFAFQPSPTSPVFGFNRQSIDTSISRSNRGSYMSNKTQATTLTDTGTQTDGAGPATPQTTVSPAPSADDKDDRIIRSNGGIMTSDDVIVKEDGSLAEKTIEQLHDIGNPATPEMDLTVIDMSDVRPLSDHSEHLSRAEWPSGSVVTEDPTARLDSQTDTEQVESERDQDADDEDDEDDDLDGEEEPVIFEVATAAQPTRPTILSTKTAQVVQAKGALVTIGRRAPPPLPLRSPARISRGSRSDIGDVSGLKSPLRNPLLSATSATTEPNVRDESAPVSPLQEGFVADPLANSAAVSPLEGESGFQTTPQPFVSVEGTQEGMSILGEGKNLGSPPHASSGEDSLREPQTPQTPRPIDHLPPGHVAFETIAQKVEPAVSDHPEDNVGVVHV